MKYVCVNYNADPQWILDYTDDYLIFDRSDIPINYEGFDLTKVIKTENIGHCDYDKLSYLVDNYETLPEVFYWGKVNLWKHITKEEFEPVKEAREFTPILTKNHKVYADQFGVVCFYENGMYLERNDTWYQGSHLQGRLNTYGDFAREFFLPNPSYIKFAPGGNYILTKDRVHRYSRDFYDKMRNILPYAMLPIEAQMCERSYYELWK